MTNAVIVKQLGPVSQMELNRPDVGNSITVEMALHIAEAIAQFTADTDARVLAVTEAGERSFCAGGDLNELLEITEHAQADRAGPLGFARLNPAKPTIAACERAMLRRGNGAGAKPTLHSLISAWLSIA